MTTPRPHAELAAQLHRIANTRILSTEEIGALHTAANIFAAMPPIKRTITLTVNGREWVLPEPLREAPEQETLVYTVDREGGILEFLWVARTIAQVSLDAGRIHATEADAQAWADFDMWCRGGGHD